MVRYSKTNVPMAKIRSIGIVRILFCTGLGLVGAWFAAALAISGITRVKAPQAALAAVPNESTALGSQADQLFFANPRNLPVDVEILARQALKSQAVNAKALRVLGYYSDAKGDTKRAEKLVRMAASLSRREPGAQLWLIEASARQGDVAQTLYHYDIALRTKPDTQAVLFPRLANAIEDGDVRSALQPYIRTDREWVADFLSFANANSKNLPLLADLIIETGGLFQSDRKKIFGLQLLNRLVSEKYYADARRLFLRLYEVEAARMTSASFDESDRDARFGPMSWQVLEDSDAGGGFTGKADGSHIAFTLFANSATTRPVASKLLYLSPGNYLLTVRLANLDRGDGGFLRWQLRCPVLDRGVVWRVDSVSVSLSTELAVPANCPVQFLDLIASGGNGQRGLEATIASVSVSRAN